MSLISLTSDVSVGKILLFSRPRVTAFSMDCTNADILTKVIFLCSSITLYNSSVNERDTNVTFAKSRTMPSAIPSIAARMMFALARERISVLISVAIGIVLSIWFVFLSSYIFAIVKIMWHSDRDSHQYDRSPPAYVRWQLHRNASILVMPVESPSRQHEERSVKAIH